MKSKQQNKQLIALIVQNDPKILCKAQNIQKCKNIIENNKQWNRQAKCQTEFLDIIIFPEMAFTGYNFQNYAHVLPMACFVNTGEDFDFCRQLAIKYNSYVIFGYVEKVKNQSNSQKSQQFQLYNSAAVLDRKGNLILNTRKSHLYFCDELWSKQGDGFKSLQIINRQGKSFKCVIGICMDINQKNFSSGEYQLANYIQKNKCECLIFISNWTDNSPKTNARAQLFQMINYWLYRLSPLLEQGEPQRLFFISDRIGSQFNYHQKKQSWFFGCSGGLNLNPPFVYNILDKRTQTCILIKGQLPQVSKK